MIKKALATVATMCFGVVAIYAIYLATTWHWITGFIGGGVLCLAVLGVLEILDRGGRI